VRRYVVVDKQRASPMLQSVAIDVLRLVRIHEDERYELFVPDNPPPCTPRSEVRRRRLLARFQPD